MELRSTSELALHRKWIKELQELVAALQDVVKQGKTMRSRRTINGLKETIVNLKRRCAMNLRTER